MVTTQITADKSVQASDDEILSLREYNEDGKFVTGNEIRELESIIPKYLEKYIECIRGSKYKFFKEGIVDMRMRVRKGPNMICNHEV